ncbi:MAG: flagellar hook-associated protein FlgK [Solirubrobacterales bacterium 70-9]|nr:MAG: flagellar hook-associated protein FlgK [Solirubrobacterales bacterium 70-9]
MGISTFTGLQTALRGLIAQQDALDTTGHNISNASTPGYSRQEAVMRASTALPVTTGTAAGGGRAELGTGVDVVGYSRARDQFLDLQYRAQAMRLGGLAARVQGLETVEGALAEPGESGLSAQLQTFWSDWEGLANDPENTAARQAVIEAGRSLATTLAELGSQMTEAAEVASAQFTSITGAGGEVETIGKEIAALNGAIRSAITSGSEPNDLLDRRDLLLDQLSGLGQVSVTELGDGTVEVGFGDAATPLVSGTTVTWPQTLSEPKGKLGALLELAQPGGTIESFQLELNGFAEELADAVNTIHASGGGPAFFTYTAGSGASTLEVAVSAGEVQTASDGTAGGNDLATAIGALRGGKVDRTYAAFVTRVGTVLDEARKGEANAQTLLDTVQERRESVSGVSLDEEMTNLIRYQRGYEASARTMTALDEALDTLINRTGRVGL